MFGGRASSAGAIEPKGAAETKASEHTPAPPLALRVFPDAPLQVERVRGMDADVRVRARQIDAGSVPFTGVAVHVILKDGVLSVDPFALQMPQGHFEGVARIDARGAVRRYTSTCAPGTSSCSSSRARAPRLHRRSPGSCRRAR